MLLFAALILGILGGVIGFVTGLLVYGWAAVVASLEGGLKTYQFLILGWPIVSLIGAVLIKERWRLFGMSMPEIGGLMMLVSAAGMVSYFGVNSFAVAPAVLAGAGAILALLGADELNAAQAAETH